eukprot:COSAG01_NODE_35554_length_530_cov_1.006961_1_plen_28_part_01
MGVEYTSGISRRVHVLNLTFDCQLETTH